jgi:hypothetical protein
MTCPPDPHGPEPMSRPDTIVGGMETLHTRAGRILTRAPGDRDPGAISAVSTAVSAPVDGTAGAVGVGGVAGRVLQGTAQVPEIGDLQPPGRRSAELDRPSGSSSAARRRSLTSARVSGTTTARTTIPMHNHTIPTRAPPRLETPSVSPDNRPALRPLEWPVHAVPCFAVTTRNGSPIIRRRVGTVAYQGRRRGEGPAGYVNILQDGTMQVGCREHPVVIGRLYRERSVWWTPDPSLYPTSTRRRGDVAC